MRQPTAFPLDQLPQPAAHVVEAAFRAVVAGRSDGGWAGTWPAARAELRVAIDEAAALDAGTLPQAVAAVITAARRYTEGGDFATLAVAIDAAYGPPGFDPTRHRRAAVIQAWGIIEFTPPNQKPTRHVIGTVHSHPRIGGGEPYVSGPLAELDIAGRRAVTQRGRPIELIGDPLDDDEIRFEVLQAIVSAPARWGLPDRTDWRRMPIADENVIAAAAARQSRNVAASPGEADDQAFIDGISILNDRQGPA